MRFFLRFFFTSIVLYGLIQFQYIGGVVLTQGVQSLLIFVFLLGLLNLVLGSILRLLTLPLRILSLGAIGFAISILIVTITDQLVDVVSIGTWTSIVIIALVMGIISSLFS